MKFNVAGDTAFSYRQRGFIGPRRATRGAAFRYGPSLRLGDYDGVVTPGQMLDRANQVDGYIDGLNNDAMNANGVDAATLSQFAAFAATWKTFLDSLQGVTGYGKRLWGGTMDQIESYAAQALAWRSKLASVGVSVTGPDIPPPAAAFPFKTAAIAAAVIVGGFVVMKALDFLPKRSAAVAGYGSYSRRRRRGSR